VKVLMRPWHSVIVSVLAILGGAVGVSIDRGHWTAGAVAAIIAAGVWVVLAMLKLREARRLVHSRSS
jgi:hypothetical protein